MKKHIAFIAINHFYSTTEILLGIFQQIENCLNYLRLFKYYQFFKV